MIISVCKRVGLPASGRCAAENMPSNWQNWLIMEDWDQLSLSSKSTDSFFEEDVSIEDNFLFGECEGESLFELYEWLMTHRYVVSRERTQRSHEFVDQFFCDLPDKTFRQFTRMDRFTFLKLMDMILDHLVFFNNLLIQQSLVCVQLAVTLDRLGHYGNGACIRRSQEVWGVGHGTMILFTQRVNTAFEDRLKHLVKWLDETKRQNISLSFAEKGFRRCIRLLDGMLLPLSQRLRDERETHFDRKSRYSINAQLVCDHTKKILYCFAGMPSNCHDFNCLKKSRLWSYLQDEHHFDAGQFLLCDSGYSP